MTNQKDIEAAEVIERLKAENLRLREALEQYANPQNWRYWHNSDVGAHDAWLDFKPGHYSKTHHNLGIWIAKEALEGKLG